MEPKKISEVFNEIKSEIVKRKMKITILNKEIERLNESAETLKDRGFVMEEFKINN